MSHQSRLLHRGVHAAALSALACASVLTLALTTARPAQAQGTTILTFDPASAFTEGSPIPQSYGDNVNAATVGGFQYGGSSGFTPNVTVSYGPGGSSLPQFHITGYGNLTNYMQGPLDQTTNLIFVTFTPDPGFSVTLNSLDIATLHDSTTTVNALQVFTAGNVLLYNQANAPVTGGTSAVPAHTHYDFSSVVTSTSFLTLQIDASNIPTDRAGAIALDNITFTQTRLGTTAAPEPGALALLSVAALPGVGAILRRRRFRLQG